MNFRRNLDEFQVTFKTKFRQILDKIRKNSDKTQNRKNLNNLDIGNFRQFRRGAKYV